MRYHRSLCVLLLAFCSPFLGCEAEPPPLPEARFEMRGLAGRPLAFAPGGRFDLELAVGIAGQHSLATWCHTVTDEVERNDTFGRALARAGLIEPDVRELTTALQNVFDFRRCRTGDRFEALVAPSGEAFRFVYKPSLLVRYHVDRRGDGFVARREERTPTIELASVGVQIQSSLWSALAGTDRGAALVMEVVDIFAWDIDFYMDTRPGDTIRLLVEQKTLDGAFIGFGRVLGAEYASRDDARQAFLYKTRAGQEGYFDAQGGSLRKAFLKSPLKFTHVTSRFGMRVHPILGFNAIHEGVDLSAPPGTPIWAPADGNVTFAGRKGNAGIMVSLRHTNGYATQYLHLRRIGPEVKTGARVHQKQEIGEVGSTGLSTGPHLHYGMTLCGRAVNPMSQRFPPADPVPQDELPAYRAAIEALAQALRAIRVSPVDTPA